jgi:hypothetical protein
MGEKNMLTCPNNICGKVFDKPLKTINLQKNSKTSYDACPYCFTEIGPSESETTTSPEKSVTEIEFDKENSNEVSEKIFNCNHHLGYLKERDLKQQIPEECILCEKVIDCMLK